MGCSRIYLCDCGCLLETAVVNRLIFPCICLRLWSQLLQISTAMTSLPTPLQNLCSCKLHWELRFNWMNAERVGESACWQIHAWTLFISWTLSNTQTACVLVQSYLSFPSDHLTMLICHHNLLIAQNGRPRRLEAVQGNTGGRDGVIARTKSYETAIDWWVCWFSTLPPAIRGTINA